MNRNTLQYHSYNNLRSHTLTSELGDEGELLGLLLKSTPQLHKQVILHDHKTLALLGLHTYTLRITYVLGNR